MSGVRWTDQAVEDVRSIREFIERDSPRYGRLVAERLVEATERLEAFLRSGRIVPEVGRDDLREVIVGDYRIVYRIESGRFPERWPTSSAVGALQNKRLLLTRKTEWQALRACVRGCRAAESQSVRRLP